MTGSLPQSDIKDDDLPPPEGGEEGGDGLPEGGEAESGEDDLPPPQGEAGKGAEGADTGDGPPRPKKKNRTSFNKRIGDLTARATTAEETAANYKRELEALRGEHGETQSTAIHYGRRALENEIKLLTRDLKDATEAADAALQAELTSKLAAANAQLARFPAVPKEGERKPEAKPPAETPTEKKQAEEQGVGEEVPPHLQAAPGTPKAAWLEANAGWLDPQSPDYDPGMEAVARRYASALERDLIAKNRTDLIGTQWYFDRIDRQMATAFPQEYEMPTERQPPTRGNGTPPMRRANGGDVAPPSRPGGGGRQRLPDLTPEEKEMALMMPRKTHQDGRLYTNAEMLASYAKFKANPNAGAVPVTFRGRNGEA